MADKTFKVSYSIEGRWTASGSAQLIEAKYRQLCSDLDSGARGYERQRVAEVVMETLGVNFSDGEIDDFEIEDFCSPELEAQS